jgi:hypothetical protein
MNPPHRVLHIEPVLKLEGDRIRVADDEEIAGNDLGVDRPRPGAIAPQKILLAFGSPTRCRAPVGGRTHIFPVALTRLLFAELQQRRQCFVDRRIGTASEDHAPSGFGEILRLTPSFDAKCDSVSRCWRRFSSCRCALWSGLRGEVPSAICAKVEAGIGSISYRPVVPLIPLNATWASDPFILCPRSSADYLSGLRRPPRANPIHAVWGKLHPTLRRMNGMRKI